MEVLKKAITSIVLVTFLFVVSCGDNQEPAGKTANTTTAKKAESSQLEVSDFEIGPIVGPLQINDAADIERAYSSPEDWNGRLVSVAGTIEQIEDGHKEKPYIKIRLQAPNEQKTSLWIGSLLNLDGYDLKVGKGIVAMGIIAKVKPRDEVAVSFNSGAIHMLGYCFVDPKSEKAFFQPVAMEQCNDWARGVPLDDIDTGQ